MNGAKKKIGINDLRADKGGDPEIYRRALSNYDSSATQASDGDCSASASHINEALALDSQRRSTLTDLEGLRSKLSTLQKTVIAPKKKANEDVTQEVAQLKEWKMEIAKLSNDVKAAEKSRDVMLGKINKILEGINLKGMEPTSKDCASDDEKVPNQKDQQQTQPKPAEKSSTEAPATPIKEDSASPSISLPLLSPEKIKSIPPERILNLNVGVLGHVDTGKTSLVKTLSSVLSTASLDKSKQSRARGITLDLGFSAFLLPLPEHLRVADVSPGDDTGGSKSHATSSNDTSNNGTGDAQNTKLQQKYDLLQVTLVDCPGHASLIRTIIGGAQIIDMVLLVVDATKGMQTQTAECLVIAEMTTRNLIVVLNKIDMFPENEREERLRMAQKKMRAALRGTKFEDAQMVGISACVGGEKVAAIGGASGEGDNGAASSGILAGTNNIHGLLDILQSQMRAPNRDARPSPDRFHFAVDHCFPIKGQGTVLTGTCLSGSARPNDMVEFPTLATQKKVKGLQMFRRKANIIQQGDRAGICVSNFDAKLMERGIIASPGTVKLIRGAIAVVRKVRFFKGGLNSGAKFHVSVGHTTVMAIVTFWGAREIAKQVEGEAEKNMEKNTNQPMGKSSLGGSADLAGLPRLKFDWDQDFLHQDNYLDALPTTGSNSDWNEAAPEPGKRKDNSMPPLHWARLEFLTPVYCPMDSLVIGSRLDSEVNANACRLAFSGRLVERFDAKLDHGRLKSYTKKEKVGTVCRLGDQYRRTDDDKIVRYEVFGTNLFKKETNMTQFVGLLIETDRGDVGSIQSSFGTSGKFRINFPAGTDVREGGLLYLRFKRYANDPKKAIHQDGSLPPARTGSRVDPPAKKKKNKGKNGNNQNGQTKANNNNASEVVSTNDKNTNAATLGEIVKLKGDVLDNGKSTMAIVSGLFSMEDDISHYKGRQVLATATEEKGMVEGSFGKMGKCKVSFKDGISAEVGSRVIMPGKPS